MGLTFRLVVLVASLIAMPFTARASVAECQLALILAMDGSDSITPPEHAMVRAGTAEALRHPVVASAFPASSVKVMVVEFSTRQLVIAPWTLIRSPADLDRIAAAIAIVDRVETTGGTAIGVMMEAARRAFDTAQCRQNVLDILTDGQSNEGTPPVTAREQFREGVDQVNFLYVGDKPNEIAAMELLKFGQNAFVQPIAGFEQVGLAMMRKLVREVVMGLSERAPA
jgi:Ca-activated chloride channel family protein